MQTNRLPVSSRPEFVALPSDPRIPFTPAQEAALWGGDVEAVLRDCQHEAARGTVRSAYPASTTTQHSTPETAAVRNGVAHGR